MKILLLCFLFDGCSSLDSGFRSKVSETDTAVIVTPGEYGYGGEVEEKVFWRLPDKQIAKPKKQ